MLQKVKNETQKDPELQQLKTVVMDGWPQIKDKSPIETRPYWNYRVEISCYEGLIFKGHRIIVPHSLRPEILHRMLEKVNAEHEGEVKCFGPASMVQLTR